jgi:hypothetical protein
MSLVDTILPKGSQSLYVSLREAGVSAAAQRRNVPWFNVADDGTGIFNAWRNEIEERDGHLVALIDARTWSDTKGARRRKRDEVIRGLQDRHAQQLRIVVLESRSGDNKEHNGTRFDDGETWLVEDTGTDFLLWRGRESLEVTWQMPNTPQAFGHLNPLRKEVTSKHIERDARVRSLTLNRAKNRCEIPDCLDGRDFACPDVHHITRLGDGGADHTDNTVALCPACHCRVHRGTGEVQARIEAKIEAIRSGRRSAGSARKQ